jgi:acyl carrier protein
VNEDLYPVVTRAIEEVLDENRKPRVAFDRKSRILQDLDLDSLNLALLIVKLEERTGRDPFRDGFENFQTVGELVDLYQKADARTS